MSKATTALVCRRIQRYRAPGGRAVHGEQKFATASQKLTAKFGDAFNETALTRQAYFKGGVPAAIEDLQGGRVGFSNQILVTVSQVLTPDRGHGVRYAEAARMTDRREAGLAGAKA